MSTARTAPLRTAPTDLPSWAQQSDDLEAMYALNDDLVDTAVIPRLALRSIAVDSVLPVGAPALPAESAPQPEAVAQTEAISDLSGDSTEPEAATIPAVHSLRHRHASAESVAAVRRNLIAVACVVVSIVVIGAAVAALGAMAGAVTAWIAVAAYTLIVASGALALRITNQRYAPRHSRYAPRHA